MVALTAVRRRAAGRAGNPMDAPALLLGWATGFLADDRAEWGRAMAGSWNRSRDGPRAGASPSAASAPHFSSPPRRADSGRLVVGLVAAAVSCAGLTAYSLVRYAGLLADRGTGPTPATFGAVLAGLALMTAIIVGGARRVRPDWPVAPPWPRYGSWSATVTARIRRVTRSADPGGAP
jgi:hypothetical protein